MSDNTSSMLRRFILDELIYVADERDVADDSDLLEAGLDSMGIMRLVVFIEETFRVQLPDQEVEPANVASISRICQWIDRHRKA